MSTYAALLKQKEDLDRQVEEARLKEIEAVISGIREQVKNFNLTPDQIFGTTKRAQSAGGAKVAPKYRHPETGATWTGRGKPPAWIANQDRAQFAI